MLKNFWGNDVTVIIAFIISCLSILSYFLAINEYYSKKAYWDYYHVHDKCRSAMRSGFHAEYLSYAVVLLTVFVIIFEALQSFWANIQDVWFIVYVLMNLVLLPVLYLFFRLILWKFHLTDVNERLVWENIEEYKRFIKVKSRLYFVEYGICCSAVLLGMFVSISRKSLFIFGIFIILIFIFMQFENYSKSQILLSYRKWIDVTVYNEHTYAIIEENLDCFYLIKCYVEKETLRLYLDNFLLIKKDCIVAETKYFTKIDKYCNSKSCSKHFIVGYRSDLGSGTGVNVKKDGNERRIGKAEPKGKTVGKKRKRKRPAKESCGNE